MDATLLKPLKGTSEFEEMREFVGYDLGQNRFVCRWDTIINGRQEGVDLNIQGRVPTAEERAKAKDVLMATERSGSHTESKRCELN